VNNNPRGTDDDAARNIGNVEKSETYLGRQLLEKGTLSEEDVRRIIANQRENGLLFGEAAVSLGLLTREGLQQALSEQYSYPYVEVGGSVLDPLLISAHKPFSPQAESFRTLRSELLLRWFDDGHRIIAITVPRQGQSASVVAANLAICFAQLGEKTLLIDANLRASRQQELFGIAKGPGLSTVLSGRSALQDTLATIKPFENLALMTAGPTPPNPQELLGRLSFSYLIETAQAGFDIVVIDTPPILEFADAQRITALAGGCVLTTCRHQTSLADIELCKRQISPTGAKIVGTIIAD